MVRNKTTQISNGTDWLFSMITTIPSRPSMKTPIIPISLVRINSWIWLPLNSLKLIWIYWNPRPSEPPWESVTPSPTALTGELKVFWTQSRTKDLAVHAGLSQPSELWNPSGLSRRVISLTTLNNNWSTAQKATETRDAMVVWWLMVSHTSEITVSWTRMNTPTLLEMELARVLRTKTRFLDSLRSLIAVHWPKRSEINPSQSVLMLVPGPSMPVVSWQTAKRTWTTVLH